MRHFYFYLFLFILPFLFSSCLTGRAISTRDHLNIPNTITTGGFIYVKKGITSSYQVTILPDELERADLIGKLNIAQEAYYQLAIAAGGLYPNQLLINVCVEASIVVIQTAASSQTLLLVGMYADVIEYPNVGNTNIPEEQQIRMANNQQKIVNQIENSIQFAINSI